MKTKETLEVKIGKTAQCATIFSRDKSMQKEGAINSSDFHLLRGG